MDASDTLAKLLYIGSMVLTSLCGMAQRIYLMRHPELHHVRPAVLREGLGADISMCVLFSISLVVAVLVPQIGYYALFLMVLTGVVQRVLRPVLRRGR